MSGQEINRHRKRRPKGAAGYTFPKRAQSNKMKDELLGNEGMLVIPDGLPKEELDVCPYERKKLEARELRSVRSIPLHDQSTRKNIH